MTPLEPSMKQLVLAAMLAAYLLPAAAASDQPVIDACIASWGKSSPFKKGAAANKVISPGVKVFGVGKSGVEDGPTDRPSLVLVRPAVNVAGKSTIHLSNPKGWYCFKSNVTVAGKIDIQIPCNAHIASAKEDGTAVGAVDESNKGVAVFGALRVTRYGCAEGK